MSKKVKCWAVRKGLKPGIYTDYKEFKSVTACKDSISKEFTSIEEAQKYIMLEPVQQRMTIPREALYPPTMPTLGLDREVEQRVSIYKRVMVNMYEEKPFGKQPEYIKIMNKEAKDGWVVVQVIEIPLVQAPEKLILASIIFEKS